LTKRNFFISNRCHIALLFQQCKRGQLEVQFCIPDDKGLFRLLLGRREEIEGVAGVSYDWEELPGKKASCAAITRDGVSLGDDAPWPDQFSWLLDQMLRMRRAFVPCL
jgi:hypothetical protein